MTVENFAGLPVGRWLFAIRIWLAIHLALGVAFWIQLDGAESAGVIVAMLALQTRGQTLEKGISCFLGTIVGGIMSIVIVGLFAQTRDLYILAYSAWLAVCVFAAGFLDGNRAYGAVVCGYTVSIVAVIHIDDPNSLFSEIINRCAAIAIGIVSILLVVDVIVGPDIGPELLNRMSRGLKKARVFTDGLMSDGLKPDTNSRAVALLSDASNQHLLLNALPVEAVSGSVRAGAVRAMLAALVGEICAARALAVSQYVSPPSLHLQARDLIKRRLMGEVFGQQTAAAQALAAAYAGQPVARAPRMPIYRSWESALRNSLRAFSASILVGVLFVVTGWSATAFAWAMTGIIICLSSNAPDPVAMTKGALIGLPAAVILGGITQFLILGGVDEFPLLMIGTAPTLLATLLLTSSANPALTGVGLLTTVYTIVVMQPSNPQSYNPQNYVVLSLLLVIVALLSFVMASVLFPTTNAHRRRWLFASARRDMRGAMQGSGRQRPEAEWRLLDASRIGTLAGLGGSSPADLASALRMSDLARAARRVRRELDRVAADMAMNGGERELVERARDALSMASAESLRRVSTALADPSDEFSLALAADMTWTADLIDLPAEPVWPPEKER